MSAVVKCFCCCLCGCCCLDEVGDVVLCDVAMGIISVDDVAVNAIAVDDVAFAGGVRSVAVVILPCD